MATTLFLPHNLLEGKVKWQPGGLRMLLDLAAVLWKNEDPPEALLKPPPCVCAHMSLIFKECWESAQTGPTLQASVFKNIDEYLLFEYSHPILPYLKYKWGRLKQIQSRFSNSLPLLPTNLRSGNQQVYHD